MTMGLFDTFDRLGNWARGRGWATTEDLDYLADHDYEASQREVLGHDFHDMEDLDGDLVDDYGDDEDDDFETWDELSESLSVDYNGDNW
jgi:hypothetical protein